MASAFTEERLILPVLPQLQLTYAVKNRVIEDGRGSEVVQPLVIEPQVTITIPDLLLTKKEYTDLLAFFEARQGSYEGFCFRLPDDCKLTNTPRYLQLKGTTLNSYQQGLAVPIDATTYQIIKRYAVGTVTNQKTIYKPLATTVRIYVNGSLQLFGCTLDATTGRISFSSPPSGVVTVECDYDLPVRFDTDKIEAEIVVSNKGTEYYRINRLLLKEISFEKHHALSDADFETTQTFELPFLPEITKTSSFEIQKEQADNNQEVRKLRIALKKGELLSQNAIDAEEAEYLINFFVAHKGSCVGFNYAALPAKFNQDTLTISLIGRNVAYGFEYQPIEIVIDASLLNNVSPDTYFLNIIDTSGSMASVLPTVTTTISQLRNLIKAVVWKGDAALANKYVPEPIYRGDERFLQWFNIKYNLPGEPDKHVAIAWINEASAYYNDVIAPVLLPAFISDLEAFLLRYDEAKFYRGFVCVIDTPGVEIDVANFNYFCDKLINDGNYVTNYPTPLSAYNTTYIGNLDSDVQPSTLIELITNGTDYQRSAITKLCHCVKIERTDGVTLGFTSSEFTLNLGSVVYKSQGAIDASAFSKSTGLSPDNLEIKSFINDDAISDEDLLAGRYDGAKITIALVNFVNTPTTIESAFIVGAGYVGQLSRTESYYQMELRSSSALLNQNVAKKTANRCPYTFGDSYCQKSLAGLTTAATITNIDSSRRFTVSPGVASGLWDEGVIQFSNGDSAPQKFDIYKNTNGVIELYSPVFTPFSVGDTVLVTQGCKKTQEACSAYGNIINFGGFPQGGNFMRGADFYTSGKPVD